MRLLFMRSDRGSLSKMAALRPSRSFRAVTFSPASGRTFSGNQAPFSSLNRNLLPWKIIDFTDFLPWGAHYRSVLRHVQATVEPGNERSGEPRWLPVDRPFVGKDYSPVTEPIAILNVTTTVIAEALIGETRVGF